MKKLFFTIMVLITAGTTISSEQNQSWYQRGKKHIGKHWKKYATVTAAATLGTAAYLNRDRLSDYTNKKGLESFHRVETTLPSYWLNKLQEWISNLW